jgi:hypothetical protein
MLGQCWGPDDGSTQLLQKSLHLAGPATRAAVPVGRHVRKGGGEPHLNAKV